MERSFQNESYLAPLTAEDPSSLQSLGCSVSFSGKLIVNGAANVKPQKKDEEAFCPGAFCYLYLLKNTKSTTVLSPTPSAFSVNSSPEAAPFAFPKSLFHSLAQERQSCLNIPHTNLYMCALIKRSHYLRLKSSRLWGRTMQFLKGTIQNFFSSLTLFLYFQSTSQILISSK